MKQHSSFFCSILIIMLTCISPLAAQVNNTITITPLNRIISNMEASTKEPIEGHVLKNVDIVENDLFSIYTDLGTLERFIKITSLTPNIEFVRFRRDKNNGYITFRSYNSGKARLTFQIDSEDTAIKKYIYTINITNNITNNSIVPSASDTPIKEEIKPIKNIIPNITKQPTTDNTAKPKESSVKKVSSANVRTEKKTITQEVPQAPKKPSPPKIPTPPLFAQSSIIENNSPAVNNNSPNSILSADTSMQTSSIKDEDIMLYKMAEDFRTSKSYDNALKTYNDIIYRYPNSTNSLKSKMRLAEIYTIKKDYNNAYNNFKLVYEDKISKENDKAYALYSMGLSKKLLKDYSSAKDNFIEVMNKYPNSKYRYDSAYDYAHTLSLENKMSDGITILESALSGSKDFDKRENALVLLGEIYERGDKNVRDYQKAYDTYTEFLKDYPSSRLANEIDNRRKFISRNFLNLR